MATTVDTSERTPITTISLVGDQEPAIEPATDCTKVFAFGIDLTDYHPANQARSSRYTPMGRYLEDQESVLLKYIIPSTQPNTAGRKKKTMRNRKKGSMVAEVPRSERSLYEK